MYKNYKIVRLIEVMFMPRKCRACLCKTCLKTCKCKNCKGKIKECKEYIGCNQISIFKDKKKNTPRYSWKYYGITKERRKELKEYIRSDKYAALASQAAHTANEMIAEYILLSIKKNKRYEDVENVEGIGRIPYGRTDFYGIRRYFYHVFNEKIKEIGK